MDTTALFDLSYGLYIVASNDMDMLSGCIINTVFQITNTPQTLAISINKENCTNGVIRRAGKFTISVLGEPADMELIGRFGFRTSKEFNKFTQTPHQFTQNGIPYITDRTTAYFECSVIKETDMGTHTVFFAEITDAKKLDNSFTPMTYSYYHKVVKGRAPKTAPTYVEETPAESGIPQYRCDICGYIYEGDLTALPDDWKCPVCGAGKEHFKKL